MVDAQETMRAWAPASIPAENGGMNVLSTTCPMPGSGGRKARITVSGAVYLTMHMLRP